MQRIKTSVAIAALAAVIATAAFAADPLPRPTPHPPFALAGTSLAWCGDIERPRADPTLYHDRPVSRSPVGRMGRWAREKPGFVLLGFDRGRNGWVFVQFTHGVKRRQAELEREFPGVGVVVVKVANSKRDLRRLADRVGDFVERWELRAGWGWGNANNIVELRLPVVSEELAMALDAEFAGEPLCVEGPDPQDLPEPGPQPVAGDGWRMLGWEQGSGPAYEVGIATEQGAYERLWQQSGLGGTRPDVDFVSEVVVWFSEGHGGSCPNLRMDEVIVDHDRSQVYPLIAHLDEAVACTSDLAGAYQFVAAVERAELPPGPFEIGLGGGDGELWRSLRIDTDLTLPGAVAGPDDIEKLPER